MSDWTVDALEKVQQAALKCVVRACIACVNDLKVTVSVPAPRLVAKRSGRIYAATKATPGAPPRKLTGRGRAAIAYRIDKAELTGYVGNSVIYMSYWERHDHKWVRPTLAANKEKYSRILAGVQ